MTTGRVFGLRQAMGLKQGEGKRQRKRTKQSLYGKNPNQARKAKKCRDQERDQESLAELKAPPTAWAYGVEYYPY